MRLASARQSSGNGTVIFLFLLFLLLVGGGGVWMYLQSARSHPPESPITSSGSTNQKGGMQGNDRSPSQNAAIAEGTSPTATSSAKRKKREVNTTATRLLQRDTELYESLRGKRSETPQKKTPEESSKDTIQKASQPVAEVGEVKDSAASEKRDDPAKAAVPLASTPTTPQDSKTPSASSSSASASDSELKNLESTKPGKDAPTGEGSDSGEKSGEEMADPEILPPDADPEIIPPTDTISEPGIIASDAKSAGAASSTDSTASSMPAADKPEKVSNPEKSGVKPESEKLGVKPKSEKLGVRPPSEKLGVTVDPTKIPLRYKVPVEPSGKPGIPSLVLWHTYDGNREDVLDWSRHGSLGEWFVGDKIPTRRGWTFRGAGTLKNDFAWGYRIMPSDALELTEGSVSFWLCVDPDWKSKKAGVILSANTNGTKRNISVSRLSKGKYTVQVSFSRRKIETKSKLKAGEYYHFAWTFNSEKQVLYINGVPDRVLDTGATLPGGEGMYVGYAFDAKKNTRSMGYCGLLDDLRIYADVRTNFPDVDASPMEPFKSPFGLVLDLEFDTPPIKKGDSLTMKDYSGMRHEIVVEEIHNTQGKASPLIEGDRGSWVFHSGVDSCSMVWIKGSDDFSFKEGTLEVVFRVNKENEKGDPRWYLCSSCSDPKWTRADCALDLYCWSPKNHRATMEKLNWKPADYFQPRAGTMQGAGSMTNARPYFFKKGDWVRIVMGWGYGSDGQTTKMWVNDVRVPMLGNGFQIYKKGGLRIGRARMTGEVGGEGFSGEISRVRVWNYRWNAYPNEIPPEQGLPTFYLNDPPEKK